MKIREYKKRNMLFTLVVGAIALTCAFAVYAIGLNVDVRIAGFMSQFGFLMLLATLYQYFLYRRDPDMAMGDERTQKLARSGIFYSWLLSILFIFILLVLDYLGIMKMTVFLALSLALAFMIISGMGLGLIFLSRSDSNE